MSNHFLFFVRVLRSLEKRACLYMHSQFTVSQLHHALIQFVIMADTRTSAYTVYSVPTRNVQLILYEYTVTPID
jgi:hypothetical protein